ncbi:hypothetical protein [Absidia glauca]|uniref:Uncharacterized protein n=1 Tax=Absidia glauca TaxID=4829 RepID=A0A168P8K1_ABSGL|nr:hypothetical protein [Absidia glauca]
MDQEKRECQVIAGSSRLGTFLTCGVGSMDGERQEYGNQGHKGPYQLPDRLDRFFDWTLGTDTLSNA